MISIVDNVEAVRNATKALLRSRGYLVVTFASAEEFLKSERLNDTTCLISDVHMPGLSGLELQERLAAGGYQIPIIFITAFPESACANEPCGLARSLSCASRSAKPTSSAALTAP